uniref:Uncharacterized protein n=1 Tax=Candidatus Kentrum sp. FW TaxID=2126338 RepID=A0A450S0X8_9GAMM|nr:MAG: hypothetical protein BECKFW1821A_GA0114235_100929 [Candidatus Kentron sp. FW]
MPTARIEDLKHHYYLGDTIVRSPDGVIDAFEYPGLPKPAHRGEIPDRQSCAI